MDRKVFTAILLSVVVVALVYLAYHVFRPFLPSILWAAVLAAVSHEAHERLAARLGGRRSLAAAIMTFLVFLVIVGPFILLTLLLVDEAITFANQSRLDARIENVMDWPVVAWAREKAADLLHEEITAERIADLARQNVLPLLVRGMDVVRFAFSLLSGIVMMLLSLFFFYRDGAGIVRAVRELVPMADADRDEVLGEVSGAVHASVRGGLLLAAVQGLLGFGIFLALGVAKPVLLAAAMTIASFVPIVGTTLVWAPTALYLGFVDHSPVKAVILAIFGAVIIGGSDNVLRPLVLGRHMEAHPLMLFFGVLGGIALFGFAGIVLGPIAVAFVNVTARLLRRRFASAT
jgi:predicted PurR-regulated permease PerM